MLAKINFLYRTASVVFFICFGIYILFSRQPDYFSSDTAKGTIQHTQTLSPAILKQYHIKSGDYTVVKYAVGKQIFYLHLNNNQLVSLGLNKNDVTVIFDADYPEKAAIYKWFGYWIVLDELIIFFIAYAVLFGVAIAVTGKSAASSEKSPDIKRQMKYN